MLELLIGLGAGVIATGTVFFSAPRISQIFANNKGNRELSAKKKNKQLNASPRKLVQPVAPGGEFYPHNHLVKIVKRVMDKNEGCLYEKAEEIYKVLNEVDVNSHDDFSSLLDKYNNYRWDILFGTRTFSPYINGYRKSTLDVLEIKIKSGGEEIKFLSGINGENIDLAVEDYIEHKKVSEIIDEFKKSLNSYETAKNPDQEIIQSVKAKIEEGLEKLKILEEKIKIVMEDSQDYAETEHGIELFNKTLSTTF